MFRFFEYLLFQGVFPLPNVKLTWGKFDLFADKMTAEEEMIESMESTNERPVLNSIDQSQDRIRSNRSFLA